MYLGRNLYRWFRTEALVAYISLFETGSFYFLSRVCHTLKFVSEKKKSGDFLDAIQAELDKKLTKSRSAFRADIDVTRVSFLALSKFGQFICYFNIIPSPASKHVTTTLL